MFDCVLPTRCARNGLLFTSQGQLVIRNAAVRRRRGPVGRAVRLLHLPDLLAAPTCATCSPPGRSLALRLNTLHNLHYYLELMRSARAAIAAQRFAAFASDVVAREGPAGPETDEGLAED